MSNIYVGALTTVIETLTELAQDKNEYTSDLDEIRSTNTVRFQACLDLVSVANQIRNHDRLDYIVNNSDLAKAYFAAGRPLSND